MAVNLNHIFSLLKRKYSIVNNLFNELFIKVIVQRLNSIISNLFHWLLDLLSLLSILGQLRYVGEASALTFSLKNCP